MKIEFEGRPWDVDLEGLTLAQGVVITGRMGCSLTAWEKTMADTESPLWLDSMRCLYWLMVQQDGRAVSINDVDFQVLRFAAVAGEAFERENAAVAAAEAAAADPTKPPATPGPAPGAADSDGSSSPSHG